ncbi:MAG TPA: membrane protein insertase YidC [Candidatus Dormibacteraeota bacterium]|nr:membrane protein insertase YidC [Candidatus Dormibacteraeota bacterium]
MDRTGIIVVSICVILLGFWFVEQQKYYSHLPQTPLNTNVVAGVQATTANSSPVVSAPGTVLTPAFDTNAPEDLIAITNADARYTFTSRSGGLKSVELLKYPETVSPRWKKEIATNAVATLNTHAPVPILAIFGDPSFVGDGNFTLTKTTDGVRAEKSFADGLILTKEFHVSSNYLINASVSLKNSSDKPLVLPAQDWVVGTATPMGPDDNNFLAYGGAMWFDGAKIQDHVASYFSTNTTILGLFHRTPSTEYQAGAGNVVWAASHNQFFAIIAMSNTNQPAQQIVAQPVALPSLTIDNQIPTAPTVGIQTTLVYPAQTLAANSISERQIVFYAGPKEYRTLAIIGEKFQNRADLVMQFGFFGFFAKALLSAMNWLHDVTNMGYGLAIVVITIILRAVFWPLTAAGTRSMKRMQALAPEVKALKEKYKDDPQKFTQKQMELWKKNKVSPMGGCLPMLIQTPVFIGFFTMIRSAIELRGAHFLWAADLSKPDTLFMIPGLTFIPLISTPDGLPFNLLPLLMVSVMIWQAHLQPPSPGMDPAQQKIMRFMPLMLLVILYNYSSGMALYMTVSTLSSVLQTKLTKTNQVSATADVVVSPLTPLSKKKK